MEYLTSVVIPVFYTASYIKSCYLSVINQTYQNVEVIIVNDASTDSSHEVIRQLLINTNGRMVQYHVLEQNAGVGYARNFGISKANGHYISFLDSDDWYDSNYLSIMVNALAKQNDDVAICSILNEYDNYLSSTIRYYYANTSRLSGDYALKLLSRDIRNDIYITPMVGNKVFRKEFLLDNALSFLDNNYCEDDIFSFSLFTMNPSVVLVSDSYQHYRQRENSITHCFSKKRIDDLIDGFIYLKSRLIDQGIFDEYHNEYESFFERCITTMYQSLIEAKESTQEKKKYIHHLLDRLIQSFTLKSIIEYIDINRFHRFLGLDD